MPRVDAVQHMMKHSENAEMTMLVQSYKLLRYALVLHRHANAISVELTQFAPRKQGIKVTS